MVGQRETRERRDRYLRRPREVHRLHRYILAAMGRCGTELHLIASRTRSAATGPVVSECVLPPVLGGRAGGRNCADFARPRPRPRRPRCAVCSGQSCVHPPIHPAPRTAHSPTPSTFLRCTAEPRLLHGTCLRRVSAYRGTRRGRSSVSAAPAPIRPGRSRANRPALHRHDRRRCGQSPCASGKVLWHSSGSSTSTSSLRRRRQQRSGKPPENWRRDAGREQNSGWLANVQHHPCPPRSRRLPTSAPLEISTAPSPPPSSRSTLHIAAFIASCAVTGLVVLVVFLCVVLLRSLPLAPRRTQPQANFRCPHLPEYPGSRRRPAAFIPTALYPSPSLQKSPTSKAGKHLPPYILTQPRPFHTHSLLESKIHREPPPPTYQLLLSLHGVLACRLLLLRYSLLLPGISRIIENIQYLYPSIPSRLHAPPVSASRHRCCEVDFLFRWLRALRQPSSSCHQFHPPPSVAGYSTHSPIAPPRIHFWSRLQACQSPDRAILHVLSRFLLPSSQTPPTPPPQTTTPSP